MCGSPAASLSAFGGRTRRRGVGHSTIAAALGRAQLAPLRRIRSGAAMSFTRSHGQYTTARMVLDLRHGDRGDRLGSTQRRLGGRDERRRRFCRLRQRRPALGWRPLDATACTDPGKHRGGRRRGSPSESIDSTAPGNAWSLERVVDPAVEWEFLLIRRTDGEAHAFGYRTRGASVAALAAVANNSVWIVGTHWSNDGNMRLGPIVIHWNGTSAVRQPTALDSLHGTTLSAICALSPVEIWAAGDHLLARYSTHAG